GRFGAGRAGVRSRRAPVTISLSGRSTPVAVPVPRAEMRLRWAPVNGAQLGVLSSFALAQPLLDILGRNAAFFAVRESTSREIVLFALAVTFAVPAALLGVELLASIGSRLAAEALHLLFAGGLTGVIVLHALTKSTGASGETALALAAAAAVAAAVVYRWAR